MTLVVHHTTKGLIGALVKANVPCDCEIGIDTLKTRLDAANLSKFAPRKRAFSDAIRLALRSIMNSSLKDMGDGVYRSILVTEVKRQRGDAEQVWVINWREVDPQGKTCDFPPIGNVVLKDPDKETGESALSIPGGLADVADVHALAKHYENAADHTKLRGSIEEILSSVGHTIATGFGKFTSVEKKNFIKEVVAPCFENLDKGDLTFSFLELEGTAENIETIKSEVQDTVSQAIDQILTAIVQVKTGNETITKGTVKEWLLTIENLKANMAMLGLLDVKLPTTLDDLEMQIDMIKTEGIPKRKARILQVMEA